MYLYLNKSFLFQETIILDRQNKKFKQEENLKFKSDLFKLRYLICNEKKKKLEFLQNSLMIAMVFQKKAP